MIRIERPPIEPNIGTETVQLDEPLCRIVTGLAKRLERAEPEFVDIAVKHRELFSSFSKFHPALDGLHPR
jgi:hypothetical protein